MKKFIPIIVAVLMLVASIVIPKESINKDIDGSYGYKTTDNQKTMYMEVNKVLGGYTGFLEEVYDKHQSYQRFEFKFTDEDLKKGAINFGDNNDWSVIFLNNRALLNRHYYIVDDYVYGDSEDAGRKEQVNTPSYSSAPNYYGTFYALKRTEYNDNTAIISLIKTVLRCVALVIIAVFVIIVFRKSKTKYMLIFICAYAVFALFGVAYSLTRNDIVGEYSMIHYNRSVKMLDYDVEIAKDGRGEYLFVYTKNYNITDLFEDSIGEDLGNTKVVVLKKEGKKFSFDSDALQDFNIYQKNSEAKLYAKNKKVYLDIKATKNDQIMELKRVNDSTFLFYIELGVVAGLFVVCLVFYILRVKKERKIILLRPIIENGIYKIIEKIYVNPEYEDFVNFAYASILDGNVVVEDKHFEALNNVYENVERKEIKNDSLLELLGKDYRGGKVVSIKGDEALFYFVEGKENSALVSTYMGNYMMAFSLEVTNEE